MNLSHNELKSVPLQLFQLSAVRTLNLSDNQLCGLPPVCAWKCDSLSFLDISENMLKGMALSNTGIGLNCPIAMYSILHRLQLQPSLKADSDYTRRYQDSISFFPPVKTPSGSGWSFQILK